MTKQAEYGENPFTPGAGRSPPYLAGRDALLAKWRRNQRQSGHFGMPQIMMYGPRGTGKTAVLLEFQRIAQELDCNLVRANAPILNDGQDAMVDKLLARFAASSYLDAETTSHSSQAGVGAPGFAEAGVSTGHSRTIRHRDLAAVGTVEMRLRVLMQQKPLVLMLDEAHAATSETALQSLSALANAVQQLVSEDERICLVLAGTPGLPQTLVDAGCSFADRFEEFGIGLLDKESAKAAIEKPLAEHVWRMDVPESRLGIEPAALDAVLQDSGGYPYFLQLWGSELWEQAAARGADMLSLADVASVRQSVDALRDKNYKQRSQKIGQDDDLLTAANAVAGAFQQYYATGDARFIGDMEIINVVDDALTPSYPDRRERGARLRRCMRALVRQGFVWDPPETRYMEPGIPSFLSYAQELYAARHGRRQAD